MNKGVEKGRDLDDAEVLQVVGVAGEAAARLDRAVLEGRPHRSRRQGDRRDRGARAVPAAGRVSRRRSTPPSPRRSPRPAPRSPKDMGKVMKAVMPKLAGKNADGRAVNEAVRRTAWRADPSFPVRHVRALGRVGRRRDDDQPRARAWSASRCWPHYFGASDAMDAYNVALPHSQPVPRPVRGGRDERRVRADLHAAARRVRARQSAWRLGNLVINGAARRSPA